MVGQFGAPRQWFSRACSGLLKVGLCQLPLDSCMFSSYHGPGKFDGFALLNVDDLMFAGVTSATGDS